MDFNEYVFKYEYEQRRKQFDATNPSVVYYKKTAPVKRKKLRKKRWKFNP